MRGRIAQCDALHRDRVLEKCDLLAEQPGTGRLRHDLSPDLRSFVVGRYLIFYRPLSDGKEVVHGARNIEVVLRR